MTGKNRTKIKQLINEWSRGTINTASCLKKRGFHYNLLASYKSHGWIESIGDGAYKLYNDNVDWLGGVYAVQNQLGLTIHPGGKTALELKGLAHYLSKKMQKGFLLGLRGEKLPTWYKNYDWGIKVYYSAVKLFPKSLQSGYSEYKHKEFSIKISSPERAAFEMLYHYPKYHTFDECYKIMENLVGLRPKVCQELLENCNSIKVKRLFLLMADYLEHPWFDDLNMGKIELGSGFRALVKNGALDNKYKITVPKEYKR